MIAGAAESLLAALRDYGDALGIAFQIVDDVLDYGGTSAVIGKNTGDDFRERKLTLPVIHAVANSNSEERAFWERVIEKGDQREGDLDRAMAILAAHAFPQASIDAVDISPDALAVAGRNVADYQLGERIRLVESDLFAGVRNRRYDLIVSNPPYVKAASMATLPAEYRREPELALASGEDGLDLTRAILAAARKQLKPHGLLVVEIGHNRDELEAAFPDTPFPWLDTSAGDQYFFLLHHQELP